ncbi:hypothetical protein [Deinococcus knuensis]|uniref:DUF3325 domain-containing protein n=1 Tax=Deinococcus knuensis TaxID=1837380 RepID=A0ABQ2SEC7_9DEIO|nr:hypothetical protein [Deinococcus knuensis]GGS17104.1 hypothetical protein GCM10008961_05960 [Deinococcus knuensis]
MSDLEFFLTAAAAGASLYALLTLRGAARRLHYRDRPGFWRGALVLLAGVLAVLALLAVTFLTSLSSGWPLYLACLIAAVTAALTWWVDLEPARVVHAAQSRRHTSRRHTSR